MGAMTGFAIAKYTNNLFLGFLGAAVVGALIALISCIWRDRSQTLSNCELKNK